MGRKLEILYAPEPDRTRRVNKHRPKGAIPEYARCVCVACGAMGLDKHGSPGRVCFIVWEVD
jgi:hypothetical protein